MKAEEESIAIDIALLFIVFLAGIKFTFGLEHVIDISLYDETGYLSNGINLLHGLPGATLAPLYSVWYYFLSLFEGDSLKLFYLNCRVLTIILPMLLFGMLRTYKADKTLAFVISLYFLISYLNLSVWPKPYHFAIIVIMAGLIMARFASKLTTKFLILGFASLLGSYIRPELFVIVCLRLKNFKRISLKVNGKSFLFLIAFLFLYLLLINTFGVPLEGYSKEIDIFGIHLGNRSLIAFKQHFSWNWVQWENSTLIPWAEYDYIFNKHFNNAKGITSAFFSNPSIFTKHVFYNIIRYFTNLNLVFVHHNLVFPNSKFYKIIEGLFLIFFLLLAAIKTRKDIFQGLRQKISDHKPCLIIVGILLTPPLVSSFLIYPRDHYLLPQIVMFILLFTVFINFNKKISFKRIILMSISALIVVPYSSLSFSPKVLSNLSTITFIKSLNINQKNKVNILEAEGGYNVYLGKNYTRIAEIQKNDGFYDFLSDKKINMIVLSKTLLKDSRFSNDKEWQDFNRNFHKHFFKKQCL
jgi:hypothetical protein